MNYDILQYITNQSSNVDETIASKKNVIVSKLLISPVQVIYYSDLLPLRLAVKTTAYK
jgi:hypothetical protein